MACTTDSISNSHFKSLDRVQNYPIVNDSFVLALSYYQWIKSKNSILDGTLSKAESTLKSIKDTAEPIAARKLGFIDNVVYNQLDWFEKSCPVILEPSCVIANIPSKVYHANFESTVKTVMWPATKTIDVVSKTSNMAMSAVSSVVDASIKKVLPSTNLPKFATNYVLDKTDELLDKYLPGTDEATMNRPIENNDIYDKVKHLSEKTRRRLYKRAVKQIEALQKISQVKLEQIQSKIADIQKMRSSLQDKFISDSMKDNIQLVLTKQSDLMREALHYSKNLQSIISSSTCSTIEFLSKNAISGLTTLNENLLKLQNILSESKPEFISDNVLIHTKNLINQIRNGLDSFIYSMKEYLRKQSSTTEFDNEDEYESNVCEDHSSVSGEHSSGSGEHVLENDGHVSDNDEHVSDNDGHVSDNDGHVSDNDEQVSENDEQSSDSNQ